MKTEIEAKWLDIDPSEFRAKLKSVGATRVHPERQMRRRSFDDDRGRFDAIGAWVRVRDEGDRVTMSYKQSNESTIDGMKETDVVVDSFERACDLLQEVGMVARSYQETRREKWTLNSVEITIDTWPWVPTFVELEGPNEPALRRAARELGLDWSKAMHGGVTPVYKRYYDVTYEEVNSWSEITFVPVPKWLEAKRRV